MFLPCLHIVRPQVYLCPCRYMRSSLRPSTDQEAGGAGVCWRVRRTEQDGISWCLRGGVDGQLEGNGRRMLAHPSQRTTLNKCCPLVSAFASMINSRTRVNLPVSAFGRVLTRLAQHPVVDIQLWPGWLMRCASLAEMWLITIAMIGRKWP